MGSWLTLTVVVGLKSIVFAENAAVLDKTRLRSGKKARLSKLDEARVGKRRYAMSVKFLMKGTVFRIERLGWLWSVVCGRWRW